MLSIPIDKQMELGCDCICVGWDSSFSPAVSLNFHWFYLSESCKQNKPIFFFLLLFTLGKNYLRYHIPTKIIYPIENLDFFLSFSSFFDNQY